MIILECLPCSRLNHWTVLLSIPIPCPTDRFTLFSSNRFGVVRGSSKYVSRDPQRLKCQSYWFGGRRSNSISGRRMKIAINAGWMSRCHHTGGPWDVRQSWSPGKSPLRPEYIPSEARRQEAWCKYWTRWNLRTTGQSLSGSLQINYFVGSAS